MIGSIVVLSIAYAAVAALLLSLNLATRFSFWIKSAGIVLVTLLYVGSWSAFQGLTGWATFETMPEEFRVLWITLQDRDKQTNQPGTIYFWVRELDEAGLPVGAPRAHRIDWSEESAEAAQEALDQLEEGELLNGRLGRSLLDDDEPSEQGLEYAGDPSVSGSGGERPDFEFIQVQPPELPPKSVPVES